MTNTWYPKVFQGAFLVGLGLAVQACQQPAVQPASSMAPTPVTVEFRVVPEGRNPANCRRFETALSRVHTFTATGSSAMLTSSGGINSSMTQTSPGVYTTSFSLGGTTLNVVANASSSPKSLTVTEPRLGCRFTAVAP